ncbi:MAG: ROK family protein [Saprospiraceae bacterium]|nr:ROK family protein [Saprospiraceae bacterium]
MTNNHQRLSEPGQKSEIKNCQRIVLTLDAGGTNFIFSAIQGNKEIVEPIRFPSKADNLEACLAVITGGFENVMSKLPANADAISFAFPGPADYENGIIGDLPNFPSFRGGIALGPMLREQFGIPVFINNDGDLFAHGEALFGLLPEINNRLEAAGSSKRHKNLIGFTLGTGIGCGIVLNGQMLQGDNSCAAEIHNTLNKYHPDWYAEESACTRAIQRVYAERSNQPFDRELMPADIFNIAMKKKEGDQNAAIEAYRQYGENLGSSIANVVALVDGLMVLGGGITGAWELFGPAMLSEINRQYHGVDGTNFNRLSYKVFNLQDTSSFNVYAKGGYKELTVPGSQKVIHYDDMARVGIALSRLGAPKAIAMGAYAFALQKLDEHADF